MIERGRGSVNKRQHHPRRWTVLKKLRKTLRKVCLMMIMTVPMIMKDISYSVMRKQQPHPILVVTRSRHHLHLLALHLPLLDLQEKEGLTTRRGHSSQHSNNNNNNRHHSHSQQAITKRRRKRNQIIINNYSSILVNHPSVNELYVTYVGCYVSTVLPKMISNMPRYVRIIRRV